MLHPVDSQPPTDVLITNPVMYARPDVNVIAGTVADRSGASDLEIEITARPTRGDHPQLRRSHARR
ncbi:MAG: hypothetical protein HZY76_03365 [Anaerolineae bacterium]|nr:MAG: hypothetical protein HZY76_03365 [Anaerolineae bacterium]